VRGEQTFLTAAAIRLLIKKGIITEEELFKEKEKTYLCQGQVKHLTTTFLDQY
jgi:hypothetical protein